jgi:uncharacterized protein YtpQ (UPF0354 family)
MNISTFLTKATVCIKVAGRESAIAPDHSLPGDQVPVVTDLGNGLAAVYLVDDGEHLSYVQHHHLAAINGQPRALHEMGLINLSRLAQAKLRMVGQGPVHGLLLDGLFEASLLLLDDLWEGPLAAHTPNGAVAAIPTRDVLAFCDAKSAQGIAELRELCARTMAGNDHVLTATLYRRERGAWHPLP